MRWLGAMVVTLALAQVPALADGRRVQCRDGVWVKSSKACRHRGGLAPAAYWHRGMTGRRPPTARCRDGSIQVASHRTCRHRGGVAYWM